MDISLKKISFAYKNTSILNDLSCTFHSGKINYLIGYNGAGKSTLLDIISGAIRQDTGKVMGKPNQNGVLYQTQNPAVFGALTGQDLQNFIFGVSTGHRDIIVESLPKHFSDLYQKLIARKIGDMSVGERRWLLIFLESHLNKCLFLLDEPTSGVDPVSKRKINKMLLEIAHNTDKLVIVTTHDLRDMDHDCAIYLLNNQVITTFSSYDKFLEAAKTNDIEDAFSFLTE